MGVGSRSQRSSALFVLCGLALTYIGACGGSEASTGPSAKSAHETASADRAAHDAHDEAAPDSDSPAEEEAPKAGPCDDGTCFTCGSGICPSGWYCDESAPGGPACGWVPGCEKKKSYCNCLSEALHHQCACINDDAGEHEGHIKCK